MSTINTRIAELIKQLGIKKTVFAERINVSQPFVSGLCSGAKQPSDRTISDICRVFSVSEAWLRYGEGEMLVQRSANDQLALLVNDLMAESSETFRRRFLTALLALPPESWSTVEQFLQSLQQSGNPPESPKKEITQGQ